MSSIRRHPTARSRFSTSLSPMLVTTALSLAWAGPVLARGDAAPDTDGGDAAGALEAADNAASSDQDILVIGDRERLAEAKKAARDTAGAVSIIDSSEVEKGRSGNLEDLLAFQPGVFAQAADGTGAVKISIRGSGIQTSPGYFREGIKFLYDGLPLTGPGGTPDEMLDGAAVNYTEVLYGANAFRYSAATLGGAINYSTHTGATAPGFRVSVSGGSFGNVQAQASVGLTTENGDYFLAVKHERRDGYREGTYGGEPITNWGRGNNIIANVGYRFSPVYDVRLNFRYRNEQYVNGTTLTLAQLEADPRQLTVISARKKKGSFLIGLTNGFNFEDDSRLEIGFGFSYFPHINAWRYSARPAYWTWKDLTLSLRYNRSDTWFGLESNTAFSFSNTTNTSGEARTYNRGTDYLFNHVAYNHSFDRVWSASNDLELVKGPNDLWLSTGLAVVQARRNVRVIYSAPENPNRTPFGRAVDRTDTLLAPRVGLRYQLSRDLQLVGNISRSIDPSSTWGLGGSSTAYVRDLRPQKATTFETGIRLANDIFNGSLTVYRANITDELLTIVLAQATQVTDAVIVKANADNTLHQGIEAALTAKLWRGRDGSNLSLRQAFTLNDFRYRDDAEFGNNELPGLPRRVYQAELQFDHAKGFYIGGNIRAASSYYVDYQNSLSAPSYAIFGGRAGYEDPKDRFKFYVDLRNIGNKAYVSAISPQYKLNGVDSNVFYPGEGRGIFAGATVNF
ncbi:TonB-dependent receptor [Sandaracinobacter sp. RS1-74]|uniref:TonB-dependent receptor family protein n=1 Tax=Sandaracinobacteroides sayramensis TaxID=2913411 RepID=UPI001EDB8183|nr:TonB-dependent receptor [Sandaracinobacteroides sayramensis]MCG2842443.1 TonB-dependent receptor [Sandaracinobacteroides sayramensis]